MTRISSSGIRMYSECGKKYFLSYIERVGGEDQGSHYHIVWKFQMRGADCFVQAIGHYDSFTDTSWDDAEVNFVIPYKKTIDSWKTVEQQYNEDFEKVIND